MDDIRMTQLRCRLSFTLEPLATVVVLAEMRWKKLEGNTTFELAVFSQMDLPHPACTDLVDNSVMPDLSTFD
jgi:hypothetical protein